MTDPVVLAQFWDEEIVKQVCAALERAGIESVVKNSNEIDLEKLAPWINDKRECQVILVERGIDEQAGEIMLRTMGLENLIPKKK